MKPLFYKSNEGKREFYYTQDGSTIHLEEVLITDNGPIRTYQMWVLRSKDGKKIDTFHNFARMCVALGFEKPTTMEEYLTNQLEIDK